MASINLPPFSRLFLQSMNSEGVEYLLVGGYAVRYNGYLRPTRDLDIWTGTRRENAEKISRIMRSWTLENPNLSAELFEHPNRIVRFSVPTIKLQIVDPIIGQKGRVLHQIQIENQEQIEFLTVQTGVNFDDCYANRSIGQIGGVQVSVISLQDLRKIKQAGDRPKDREDLAQLP